MYPPQVLSKLLGRPVGDFDYLPPIPSTFPIANRPLYLKPVADMSYKTFDQELPNLLAEIETILNQYPNDKALIHCVSFRLRNAIMKIDNNRLITHETGNRAIILEQFKKDKRPLALVSPSYERGIDLKDDLCRNVIFAKAPFLNLQDKQVNARIHSGQLGQYYYKADCAQSIVQGTGRHIRDKTDWGKAWLLDAQINKLITDNPELFPTYWREALR